ncbi:MAG: hypothetical protein UR87_C0024G0016 [candidate division CPR3 bacterium GW2011_GWE2_35_7]|nr:MAG: hypothetical protein UR87_C0024G0016 [candidate division CPR3 bacterium GW2011_GWE2_35_7]
MTDLSNLEKRIIKIEQRNVSFLRRILLIIFTYFSVAIYFHFINIEKPWINAIVPALGFFISTLTLPVFRRIWEKYHSKTMN